MSIFRRIKFNSDFLVFLSMFFILYPDITFGTNNFLSNKPFSIWLCLLYAMLHIKLILKRFRKRELLFIFLLIISILIGLIMGNNSVGLSREINGYIGVCATYLAIKVYFQKNTEHNIFKLLRVMLLSYLCVVLLFGGLQVVYIYLGHSAVIGQLLKSILYRGYAYFIDMGWGRVAFTFSEPSMAGLYFYCYFVPVYMLCKKYRLFSNIFLRNTLVICFLMNMLTLSVRWYIDTAICLMIYFIFIKGKVTANQLLRTIVLITVASIIVIPLSLFMFKNQFAILFNRFDNLFDNFNFYSENADYSMIVRYMLIYVGVKAFLHNPLVGFGLGRYYIAFSQFMILPNNPQARAELISCINNYGLTSYSFYATAIAEMGILGIGLIWLIISTLRRPKDNTFRLLSWFVIYMFLQVEMYGTPIIAIWLAIINSGTFIIKEHTNEDINNYTV